MGMHWYHTHDHIELNSPSRADGVDFETEARYRKEGARFIMELGNKLGLRYLPIATGWVFFHRFYMFHSFKGFPRWVTGATCLLLAGKVEETPKKCKDILKYAQQLLDDNKFKTFGENPREEVMVCERVLLQTIKFDLQLNHPYQYLIKYGKLLKGDKGKINELVQKAWTFVNESFMSTTLCLVYKPQAVALAALLLAVRLSNQNIRDFISSKSHQEWWKVFYSDTAEGELESICKELTSMVDGKPPKRRYLPNGEKKKGTDSVTNSPQPNGSPKPKKSKLSTNDISDNSKSNNASNKKDPIDVAAFKSEFLKETKSSKLTETPVRAKNTHASDSSQKQGSQTPEEMDVEKTPPDPLPVDLPELRPSKDHSHHHHHHHHHHKSKTPHQPVTLQQVQAQQNKQLKKQTQKQQKQLAQLKQQTPNKFSSGSPPQKMPMLTPIKQSQKEPVVSQQNPPPLKPITPSTPIEKRLLNLSQKSSESTPSKQSTTVQVQSPTKKTQLHDSTKTSQSQLQYAKQSHVQPPAPQLNLEQQIHQLQQQQLQQLQQQQEQQQQLQSLQKTQPQPPPPQPPPQQQPMNVSDSPLPQTINESTHSSTTTNMTDSSQAAAPILDHMSSFFQSNQTYNYPSQSYTYQQTFPPPFPQPTLPQGIPQPPQGFTQPSYMTSNHYPDTASQQTYNYPTSQPPMMMPPPPTMFHGAWGM